MMLEYVRNVRALALACALAGGLFVAACGKSADGKEAGETAPAAEAPAAPEAAADTVATATESSDAVAADAKVEQATAAPAAEVKLPAEPVPVKTAADKAAIASGSATFAANCASCHGEGGVGGFGPALTRLANRKDKRSVEDIIRKPGPSMPPLYPAMLSDQDVGEIAAWLKSIQ